MTFFWNVCYINKTKDQLQQQFVLKKTQQLNSKIFFKKIHENMNVQRCCKNQTTQLQVRKKNAALHEEPKMDDSRTLTCKTSDSKDQHPSMLTSYDCYS